MKLIINKIANSSMSIFLFFILSEMEERENFAPFKITRFFFRERFNEAASRLNEHPWFRFATDNR